MSARAAPIEEAPLETFWRLAKELRHGAVGFDVKQNCFIIFRVQEDGKTAGFALPEELNDMLKAFFLK
jgi:hypothetical protein